jgi:hypothetical protein
LAAVSTESVLDVHAFQRLKAVRFDSFQSMKAVAFCVMWQREGRTIAGVVASGWCGRRTAYNRLRSCRLAGFEPDLVRFPAGDDDGWLALDREWVRANEASNAEVDGLNVVRRLVRGLGKYKDPLDVD